MPPDEPVVAPVADAAPVAPATEPVASVTDAVPDTTAAAPAPESVTDEPKPAQPDWAKKRIDQLTKNWREEQRQKEALAERLAAFEKPVDDTAAAPAANAPKPEEIAALIQQEAKRLAGELMTQSEAKKAQDDFGAKGAAKYKDWIDRCNAMVDIGANERPEFLQAVTLMDDGPDILANLADNPNEAMRILRLPAMNMAIELAKVSSKLSAAPAPKTISSAPRPITPIDGMAKTNDAPSPNDDDATWIAKRMVQRQTKGLQRGARA